MDCLELQVVLFYIALCFCPLQSQDDTMVVPPTLLNASIDLNLQQLLLEWDVDDKAYETEKQMIFNIQINQTGAKDVVWNMNYTTTLRKSNRPIQWRWIAKDRMECMSYAVRIRSLVISKGVLVTETWSDWTTSKEVKGMDINDSKSNIFPKDKVFEKGSNISFCCIGKKGEKISQLSFGNLQNYTSETSQRRVVFTASTLRSFSFGIIVICEPTDGMTTIYVTQPPGELKDLSCETEDMVTLKCTWKLEPKDNLTGERAIQFNLSDTSNGKTYCHGQLSEYSCSFRIGDQRIYDLILEAKNALGKNHTHLNFDVAHRVHPVPPIDFSVWPQNSTAIELYWNVKHKLELLCQIESRPPDGNVDLHNVSYSPGQTYVVSGLQPYTKYTFRVRCGGRHLWKWSEWSESKSKWTKESAPSGHLDVWRNIDIVPGSDSCNVTVFWKPFPGFSANGNIKTYEIFLEMLGERPVYKNVSASDNSTTLFLENCSCKISVSAKNSVNSSSPFVIAISAASENDDTQEINTIAPNKDTINNTGIYISWKPQSQFDGYIVDWCNNPRVQPCDFQWRKIGRNQSSALITSDAFTPGVRYIFRVYGSQGNTAFLLEKKARYFKELEPTSLPKLNIGTVNSRSLTLMWDYDNLNESLPGFIRGYRVFVKDQHGNCTLEGLEKLVIQGGLVICRHTIEEPSNKTLEVKNPGPNKEYWLEVLAFSTSLPNFTDKDIGGINIKTVRIPDDAETWIIQLFSPLLVISIMLIICMCFWRSNWVKKRCCPKIPYPVVPPLKNYQEPWLPPSDFTPINPLIEENRTPPGSSEEKPFYNQDPHAEMLAVENSAFQNLTYLTEGSRSYRSLPTQDAARQESELALGSYKPLQCFTPLSNLSISTNFNYVSHKDLPLPGVMQDDQADPDDSLRQFDYKPQEATRSESGSSVVSEETIYFDEL